MTRLLSGLGLVAPAAVVLLLAAVVGGELHLADDRLAAAGIGALVAVVVGAACLALWLRARVFPAVRAVERLAAGDPEVVIPSAGGGLGGRLAGAAASLAQRLAESQNAASTDRLTGIPNRPAILATLFAEAERADRYERPLAVAFIDIDHFKAVNDTYGHAAGDAVLRGVAATLRSNLRSTDGLGRFGGEEFMAVLPETDALAATALAEKLRQLVLGSAYPVDGQLTVTVTVSIGVVAASGRAVRVEELVRHADAAMYSAKALGRNQVYVFEEPDEDARVRRAPISPEGRARAMEVGRLARAAAEQALIRTLVPYPNHRGQPSARIATLAVHLGRRLGLPEAELDRLRIAALLHDVGKLAVPSEILEKPGPLTSREWQSVVQHPRIGQLILEQAAAIQDAVPLVLHHHEHFGGHGYPFGLRGEEIPLGARIIAIADAYDAMIQDRPYKAAVDHAAAIDELRRYAGSQFDPDLVELFVDLVADGLPEPEPAFVALVGHGPVALPDAESSRRRGARRSVAG